MLQLVCRRNHPNVGVVGTLLLLFIAVHTSYCQTHREGDGIFGWRKYRNRYNSLLVDYRSVITDRDVIAKKADDLDAQVKILKGPNGVTGLEDKERSEKIQALVGVDMPKEVRDAVNQMLDDDYEYKKILKQYKQKAKRYDSIYQFFFNKNIANLESVLRPLGIDFQTDGRLVTFINITNDVFLFETGDYHIDERKVKHAKLVPIIRFLQDNKQIQFMVEGNADTDYFYRPSSCPRDNWDLSTLRATSVIRYLQSKGIDSTRMTATGRGCTHPNGFVHDTTDEETKKEKDRRVNLIIYPDLSELYKLLKEEEMRTIKKS